MIVVHRSMSLVGAKQVHLRQVVGECKYILAYRTRFSAIFTSADKSYPTYPYLTRGIDKKSVVNILIVT